MSDEPLYYAKGNEVWKRPIETPREGGGKTIIVGFKVCTCTDVVGSDGASTVAKMLSLAEAHPDAYRHGWEDREADLIDGARRVMPAPSSPGDGWVMVTVSGNTGAGKSAVMGEIEIALRALGLTVESDTDFQSEKNMTHADWAEALDLYRPKIKLREVNLPLPAAPSPGGDHG